jgi:hypothetical protein
VHGREGRVAASEKVVPAGEHQGVIRVIMGQRERVDDIGNFTFPQSARGRNRFCPTRWTGLCQRRQFFRRLAGFDDLDELGQLLSSTTPREHFVLQRLGAGRHFHDYLRAMSAGLHWPDDRGRGNTFAVLNQSQRHVADLDGACAPLPFDDRHGQRFGSRSHLQGARKT